MLDFMGCIRVCYGGALEKWQFAESQNAIDSTKIFALSTL